MFTPQIASTNRIAGHTHLVPHLLSLSLSLLVPWTLTSQETQSTIWLQRAGRKAQRSVLWKHTSELQTTARSAFSRSRPGHHTQKGPALGFNALLSPSWKSLFLNKRPIFYCFPSQLFMISFHNNFNFIVLPCFIISSLHSSNHSLFSDLALFPLL